VAEPETIGALVPYSTMELECFERAAGGEIMVSNLRIKMDKQ